MFASRTLSTPLPIPFVPALPPWKRALDLFCCVLALPGFALAWAAVALLLGLTSPGPVLFRQERVGYMGRRFTLFKFRTMHVRADQGAHQAHVTALLRGNTPMRKLDAAGDTRLVPLGWILRATGLDELPQVLNVLRGEMSIVGPRPCIPYEYERYSDGQRARCNAAPGLTGLWQVSGKNRTTFEQMVRLDVHYAQTRSLRLDVEIIARTLPALFTQVMDTRGQRRAQRQPAATRVVAVKHPTPAFRRRVPQGL